MTIYNGRSLFKAKMKEGLVLVWDLREECLTEETFEMDSEGEVLIQCSFHIADSVNISRSKSELVTSLL